MLSPSSPHRLRVCWIHTQSKRVLHLQTGPLVLLDWFRHYAALTACALLTRLASLVAWIPLLQHSFRWQRWRAAWAYGAGLDSAVRTTRPPPGQPAPVAA